jgi:hypothetical protein
VCSGLEGRLRRRNKEQPIQGEFLAGRKCDEEMPDVNGIERAAKKPNAFHARS